MMSCPDPGRRVSGHPFRLVFVTLPLGQNELDSDRRSSKSSQELLVLLALFTFHRESQSCATFSDFQIRQWAIHRHVVGSPIRSPFHYNTGFIDATDVCLEMSLVLPLNFSVTEYFNVTRGSDPPHITEDRRTPCSHFAKTDLRQVWELLLREIDLVATWDPTMQAY